MIFGNYSIFSILILFLLAPGQSWTQSQNTSPGIVQADTVLYSPGFFTWNEDTVIKVMDSPTSQILHYQEILDHSNTDFTDRPESLILICIDSVVTDSSEPPARFAYSMAISQDTIHIIAPSGKGLKLALARLRKMKIDAEKDSPDYGLIYLRCGLYRAENF